MQDKVLELEQREKRYINALKYLADKAKETLEKNDSNIDTDILALEITKVFDDTMRYRFSFDDDGVDIFD